MHLYFGPEEGSTFVRNRQTDTSARRHIREDSAFRLLRCSQDTLTGRFYEPVRALFLFRVVSIYYPTDS
jgi:hypothetical protein